MKFSVQLKHTTDEDRVDLFGPLNEEAQLELERIRTDLGPNVRFNFRGTTLVNSAGVRVWVDFLRSLVKSHHIVIAECPPEVVVQVNMIPSFTAGAEVASVLGFYACEACRERIQKSFSANTIPPSGKPMPKEPCRKCHGTMTFEENPDEYFQFHRRVEKS